MSKEAIIEIIQRHNKVVETLKQSDIKISNTQIMTAMSIWHIIAQEGLSIVSAARADGIDVKAEMQSGRILFPHEYS